MFTNLDLREQKKLRFIGLSATPLPTDELAHRLLRERFFPLTKAKSARRDWKMHVHDSVQNKMLEDKEILCPINLDVQDTHGFDLPPEVVNPGLKQMCTPTSMSKGNIRDFADEYNNKVMSLTGVLEFLADRIGKNLLPKLGKTVVFVPSIDAANHLANLLKRHPKVGPGRVTLAHSRLDEFHDDDNEDDNDIDATDVDRQIRAFQNRGNDPCVMVNVGMLTTGFDDPQIKTVVLARLTFSTNLFWQMIGRGTRGPKVGGTEVCNVIDPIRLTARFSAFEGYRPRLEGGEPYARLDRKDAAKGAVPPRISAVRRTSVIRDRDFRYTDDLNRKKSIADLLRKFLQAGLPDAADLAKLAKTVQATTVADEDGILHTQFSLRGSKNGKGKTRKPSARRDGGHAIGFIVDESIRRLEDGFRKGTRRPASVDLSWLRQAEFAPADNSDEQLQKFSDNLGFVESKKITTYKAYRAAFRAQFAK